MVAEDKIRLEEYDNVQHKITMTYNEEDKSNTVTETISVTSGKYEKDEDGNEVWVETRTQRTSTVTIGENGDIGEVSQSSSGSRTVFEVVEGLQATSPFSATPTDIKGKRLSSTKLDVPRAELSDHFKNLATTQSEYAAAAYGDSYNFRNSTAMRTNARNAQADGSKGLSLVGYLWGLTESNAQTYFDQYRNSSVPASKTYAHAISRMTGKSQGDTNYTRTISGQRSRDEKQEFRT